MTAKLAESDLPLLSSNPMCDGCGACCMHMGVPPFDEFNGEIDSEDIEWQRLPEHLKVEIEAAWERGVRWFVNKPCIWLDLATKRCRNYDWRPATCAYFEPGSPICLDDREELGIQ